jgi:hypothetical protein
MLKKQVMPCLCNVRYSLTLHRTARADQHWYCYFLCLCKESNKESTADFPACRQAGMCSFLSQPLPGQNRRLETFVHQSLLHRITSRRYELLWLDTRFRVWHPNKLRETLVGSPPNSSHGVFQHLI